MPVSGNRRRPLRTIAGVALTALIAGSVSAFASTAAVAAPAPGEVNTPVPLDSPNGQYIVLLDEDPAATYDGGEADLRATRAEEGDKLDASSPEVQEYSAHLDERQQTVAAEAGVERTYSYTLALNGFTASLSPEQAAKLAATKGVKQVVPDEIRHPVAVPSTEFLGLEGAGGVWEGIGGVDAAGEGTVVGVIDTGIAPENPSFAGEPLGTTPGDQPYLDGNDVVFAKSDGTTFRSERVTGQEWDNDDYSTKLVGAKYFSSGAAAAGFDFSYDFLSPRDGDGHGSHTASTAAGVHDVEASVEGIDFGAISGVAPAAKVAAYKACYVGPDPLVTTDDICALSDLIGAINAAVGDGVDVINYSIGGGAATTVLAPDDQAFFNAAAAGIFVAVSAGNDGPGAVTADHASPWYTTVGASTIPTYEGTVRLPDGFEAAGNSVSVPFGDEITAPVVYAGDIPAAGADPAQAALCYIGALDSAAAKDKIVVCDRGENARIEKSQAVGEAGGIGMILVNVTPGSLDNDFHSVPTVHISDTYRDALLAYVQGTPDATATLIGENVTGVETPTPQMAGFSSRGPMLADGSDVLKPDVTAPGVAILAATANKPGEPAAWEFLSGTSMSSPHVAGLAALYLGERPNATPAEIKSAFMTTAYDTVDANGDEISDPFSQGAGHVDPTKFFDPGLLYLNGPADWAAFLTGKGLAEFEGIEAIDGSDLNLASISIGSLSMPQTVTRTVTSTQAGTFTAAVDVPGVDAVVSPSSMTFAGPGETQSFEVTFTRTTAPAEEWATGSLTWSSEGTQVRSPIAVRPVTADAPAEVEGAGTTGSTDVTITPGITGELPLATSGLAPLTLLTDDANPVPGHSGNENSGADSEGYVTWIVDVPEGTDLSRFTLDSSDDTGSDLDLSVYRVVGPDDLRYYEMWRSASGSADEEVTIDAPTAGTYLIEVNVYSLTAPFTWDMTYANVGGEGEGALAAAPNPLPAEQGAETSFALSWQGLTAGTDYLGLVRYGESSVRTVLTVETGAPAPVATEAPVISGDPRVGKKLTASAGMWDPADVTTTFQWLRDGQPIDGATSSTYTVAKADAGTTLSVRVTATAAGNPNVGTADSAGVFVKATSSTKVTMNRYLGTSSQDFAVTATVTASHGAVAEGDVTVWVNNRSYTGTLAGGTVTIPLPKQSKGVKIVLVQYGGSDTVASSAGVTGFVVYR